ncbi:TPA: acyltransferase [Serratia marcescens]|nr:acyltransferase [Serratia marcescens]
MKTSTFRGVQALRGLAALSVMLFHFRWNINTEVPGLGDRLFGWGATGVDLFFLISGFVITLSAAKAPEGVHGALIFLKKRALRILPAYYIILIFSFFLSGAMSTFHYADKTENFISALTFMPIYSNHAPFYVDDNGMYGIRWTLNYEVLFYLIMSASIFLPKRWLCAFTFMIAMLVFVPMVMGYEFTMDPKGYPFQSALIGLITNPMIWMFITGMIIGLLHPMLRFLPSKIMSVAALVSLVFTVYFFSHGSYVAHGLLSSGWLYGLILLTTILSEDFIGKYIPNILMRLGDISFSLYLIHTLMNGGIGKRFSGLGIEDGYVRFIVSIILSFILAWISWRFIERPIIRPRRLELKAD